jgi:hypothetical protein
MEKFPEHAKNFVSAHVQDAVYKTEHEQQNILLEFRKFPSESELVFTIVNEQDFRVASIHELVYALPSLVSLSLSHSIRLFWNGASKNATLIELFMPSYTHRPTSADLQLRLILEDESYQTTACDTLQDAIWELQEQTKLEAEWRLCTCFHCLYSGYARDYAVSDREYWCYRDVPEAVTEIQTNGKVVRNDTRWAGAYFMDAFHTCAFWRPLAFPGKQKAG